MRCSSLRPRWGLGSGRRHALDPRHADDSARVVVATSLLVHLRASPPQDMSVRQFRSPVAFWLTGRAAVDQFDDLGDQVGRGSDDIRARLADRPAGYHPVSSGTRPAAGLSALTAVRSIRPGGASARWRSSWRSMSPARLPAPSQVRAKRAMLAAVWAATSGSTAANTSMPCDVPMTTRHCALTPAPSSRR